VVGHSLGLKRLLSFEIMSAVEEALTIGQAATLLGVTQQRVHQLLSRGVLVGPRIPGGQRAQRGAPRVWRSSAEDYLRRRRPRASNVPASSELRDDVLRLKIALDAARDVIAQERKQSRRLARLLADAVESLQEEQRLADAAEIITEQYASIVTTHLMPDPPEPSEPTLGDA